MSEVDQIIDGFEDEARESGDAEAQLTAAAARAELERLRAKAALADEMAGRAGYLPRVAWASDWLARYRALRAAVPAEGETK